MDTSTIPKAHPLLAERPVVLTVALGTMLTPLNSSMIAVALPEVMDEFSAGLTSAGWLVTAFLIAMASFQPVAGKLGDRGGRCRLFLGGLMFFGLASLVATVAPNLWVLIALRILQGVAGALIVPNGAALVHAIGPGERRGERFGLIWAAQALAAALGPPFGGLLITAAGWRAVFYVNLLLVLPALAIGWRWLPRDRAMAGRSQFDMLGGIMLPITLSATAGLLMLTTGGATSSVLVAGVLVVIMIVAVFLRWEFRHPDPVLQLRLFRRRAFAAANGGIALSNLSMYTVVLSVPLLLASRSGSSTLQAGLVLTAMSAAMVLVSPLGGRLADRFGRRLPATVGLALLTLGAVPMAVAGAEIMLPALVVGVALVGVGIGIATPGLQSTAVESVDKEDAGVALGIYLTSRYLGSIVGSAILAGLLGADRSDPDGLGRVFVVVFTAAVLATVVGLGLRARSEADYAGSAGRYPLPSAEGRGAGERG
jgi:EmrB/QacA subfamily drug resistance transporter